MPEGALSTSARKKRQNWLLCLPLETEIKELQNNYSNIYYLVLGDIL